MVGMKPPRPARHLLPALSLLLVCASPFFHTHAIEITVTQTGGFFDDASFDNAPTDQNYFVGWSSTVKPAERRSFFVFDLSGVTETVIAADFSIVLPFGGFVPGLDPVTGLPQPEEIFVLTTTPFTSAEILDPGLDPASAASIFGTFGMSGDPLTDPFAVMPGDPVVPAEGLEIILTLNSFGIDLINDNLGGEVILTGRLEDVTPGIPVMPPDPATELSELLFGLSDVVSGGTETGLPKPSLDLTTIPEPTSLHLLLGGALLSAAGRRNHHRPPQRSAKSTPTA